MSNTVFDTKLIPIKLFIHRTVLEDPFMAEEVEGTDFVAIKFYLPSQMSDTSNLSAIMSNTAILSTDSVPDKELKIAERECYQFFIENMDYKNNEENNNDYPIDEDEEIN